MYKASCIFFTILFLLSSFCVFAETLYVDGSAVGSEEDGSLDNPYLTIFAALEEADEGDTIGVLPGTYYENLRLISGVNIYGGIGGPEEVIINGTSVPRYEGPMIRADGISDVDIRHITFTQGDGPSGGAAYITNSEAVRFENCIFSVNGADSITSGGGAISAHNSTLTVVDCIFRNNKPRNGDAGAIYLANCEGCSITDSFFTSNEASTGYGGAIRIYNSSAAISGCTFSNNRSIRGGGVYVDISELVIEECLFENNSACEIEDWAVEYDGGGLVIIGMESDTTVAKCRFIGNSATHKGGGIYVGASSPTIIDCVFESNSTLFDEDKAFGGGMCLYVNSIDADDTLAEPKIKNCTFTTNSAANGGAIYNSGPRSKIVNCTIYDNSMQIDWYVEGDPLPSDRTGGIYNDYTPGGMLVLNTIVWGNMGIGQIMCGVVGRRTVRYSDVEGGYEGEGNIDLDPLFQDPAAGDFHLSVDLFGTGTSPCIDAGTPADDPDFGLLPPRDFEGDSRIIDGHRPGVSGVDMGVDEAKSLFTNEFLGPSSITGIPGSFVTVTYLYRINSNYSIPGISGWNKIFTAKNAKVTHITMDGTDAGRLIKKGLACGDTYATYNNASAFFTMTKGSLKLYPQKPFGVAAITLMVKIPEKKGKVILLLAGGGASFMQFDNQKKLPFDAVEKPITLIPQKNSLK